jgi:hypothetical protein
MMAEGAVSVGAAAVSCPGCGARVPGEGGPTHGTLGSAPGCWALYTEVLAREYGDFRFARVHRLTVDAYAVQHPGRPERRCIQSVAVHLIGLHLSLELGLRGDEAVRIMQRSADGAERFHWLEPPAAPGPLTIRDVHDAGADPEAHRRRVRMWAQCAWQAWRRHHLQIRAWAGAA